MVYNEDVVFRSFIIGICYSHCKSLIVDLFCLGLYGGMDGICLGLYEGKERGMR